MTRYVASKDGLNAIGAGEVSKTQAKMAGEFCYYYTFGLDAEGAYRFDHIRNTKPQLTKKRKINIFW